MFGRSLQSCGKARFLVSAVLAFLLEINPNVI